MFKFFCTAIIILFFKVYREFVRFRANAPTIDEVSGTVVFIFFTTVTLHAFIQQDTRKTRSYITEYEK